MVPLGCLLFNIGQININLENVANLNVLSDYVGLVLFIL